MGLWEEVGAVEKRRERLRSRVRRRKRPGDPAEPEVQCEGSSTHGQARHTGQERGLGRSLDGVVESSRPVQGAGPAARALWRC